MLSFIKKMFGDKAKRDLKALNPLLQLTLEAYKKVQTLDNDALRAKTNEFKAQINSNIAEEAKQIEDLKAEIDANPDLEADAKEKIYLQIDKLEKLQYDKTEEKLTEILPEAFSVVREVARRFKENAEVEVTD